MMSEEYTEDPKKLKDLLDEIEAQYYEVIKREQSLITAIELKQVYLDAAEKVGQVERFSVENKFPEIGNQIIKQLRVYLRNLRKMYLAYADGRPTKGQQYAKKSCKARYDLEVMKKRIENINTYGFDIDNHKLTKKSLEQIKKDLKNLPTEEN